MKTMFLITLASLLFIPLILENSADACQYTISDNTLQEDFDVYDLIFSGKTLKVGEGSPYIPVEIEVLESWKGQQQQQPNQNILLFPCKGESGRGLEFQAGKSYLIFAEKLSSEYPVVTDFGPTKLLSEAKNDILFLDQKSNVTRFSYDESVIFSPISPLKQFNSGIPFSEIKCNVNLQLTQRYDGTPACVKDETIFELIKRGWTSDLIRLVQSRDVFLDPKDATSSYMDRVTPTLDDFKDTLSEPYDIDVIFSKFGEPHDDIGSGIHIYVYELNDMTEIWIGYVDDIWYVKHVDTNGNVLEDLFVRK